jgi:hypothetical protein
MLRFFATCLVACLSTGCASIVSGNNQSISVTTRSQGVDVSGARCSLTNDKGQWYTTTPGSVTVHRSFNDLAVNCTYDGLDGGVTMAKSSTKGMAFGNILIGGIIGAGVDMASGAAYDYPDIIHVDLGQPRGPLTTTAKPSVVGSSTDLAAPRYQSMQVASVQSVPLAGTAVQPPTGEYAGNAERLARTFSCGATPVLVARGGGFETYSLACSRADPVMLRCDSASCREMR